MLLADGVAPAEGVVDVSEGVVGAVEYLMRVLEGIPGIADGFKRLCCAYLIIQKDILFCLQVR